MGLPTDATLTAALAEHVEWDATDPNLTRAAAEAVALVQAKVTANGADLAILDRIPDPLGVRACLEVGADLFYRRTARHGIAGLNSMDASPVRISRDPMGTALAILAPVLGPGIGG